MFAMRLIGKKKVLVNGFKFNRSIIDEQPISIRIVAALQLRARFGVFKLLCQFSYGDIAELKPARESRRVAPSDVVFNDQ